MIQLKRKLVYGIQFTLSNFTDNQLGASLNKTRFFLDYNTTESKTYSWARERMKKPMQSCRVQQNKGGPDVQTNKKQNKHGTNLG